MRIRGWMLATLLMGCNFSDPVSVAPARGCERDAECGDHGECVTLDGMGVCQCEPFFDGANCDTCVPGRVLVGDACVEEATTTNNATNNVTNNTTMTTGPQCEPGEFECGVECCGLGQQCDVDTCVEQFVGRRCTQDSECGDATCLTQAATGFTAGYCSQTCDTDTPCPAGTVCTADNYCAVECDADGMCARTELECGSPQGGPQACYPSGIGTGVVGAACGSVSQCAGGVGALCDVSYPDGLCSNACDTDTDCAAGSHCDGICLADCESSRDCRTNYDCIDFRFDGSLECYPAADGAGLIGAACQQQSDCGGGELGRCYVGDAFGPDGMCTQDCAAVGTACLRGTACYDAGFAQLCLPTCASNDDCRTGFQCVIGANFNVCLWPTP